MPQEKFKPKVFNLAEANLQMDEALSLDTSSTGITSETIFLELKAQSIIDNCLPSPKYTKNFIIMGAPGAGKGTLTRVLSEKFGLISISTGDSLRSHRSARTQIGNSITEILKEGALVPDNIVNEIVRQEIVNICQSAAGFALDGYPRNAQQTSYLHRKAGSLIDAVIYLQITPAQAQERMKRRRVCTTCSISYNYGFNLKHGVLNCPSCDNPLTFREDDSNPEIIKKRIEVFEKETKPIFDFYEKQNLLLTFDADLKPEIIASKIQELFYQDLQKIKAEDLIFWDRKTQENFVWTMLRLSNPDYNYGVDKKKYKEEFKKLLKYYPWPIKGDKNKKDFYQTSIPLVYHKPFLPFKNTNKLISEEEFKMHQKVLDKLLEEKAKEQNSPIYSQNKETDFDFLDLNDEDLEEDKELKTNKNKEKKVRKTKSKKTKDDS